MINYVVIDTLDETDMTSLDVFVARVRADALSYVNKKLLVFGGGAR